MNKNPVRVATLKLADTSCPMLRMKYTDITKGGGESLNPYCTLTIDANGSDTDNYVIVLLNIGASSSSYTQYQFSASASGIADPNGVDSSPTHTQCLTLAALIDAINALGIEERKHSSTDPIGIFVHRLHAPADYSLASDNFIDLAETQLGPWFSEVLYRDASEVLTTAYRLGVPESVNGKVGNGNIELVRVNALANSGGATDCVFKVSKDPTENSATDEVELGYTRYIPDNSWTELYDFHEAPPVHNGPLLFEITATSSLAVDATVQIHYRNAEV